MAIKGSLREASLPDVLQLLSLGQKSGCLALTDRSSFGYIYFERGSVCYASIVNRRDRLGDLLVKNGLVDAEVLAAAVESQGTRAARRLGEILVERGAIGGAFVAGSVILPAGPRQQHRLTFQFEPLHLAFFQQCIGLTQ